MKHLKVGLVAVVAILAMSFTIATKDAKFQAPAAGCWSQVTIDLGQTPPAVAITSTNALGNTTNPPLISDPNAKILISGTQYSLGFKVSDVQTQVNKLSACLSPFTTFCCYDVVEFPASSGNFIVQSISYKRP